MSWVGHTLRLQITRSTSYVCTLGPGISTIHLPETLGMQSGVDSRAQIQDRGRLREPAPSVRSLIAVSSGTWVRYGCFYKSGVLFEGVLVITALLFWVHIGAPDVWKLPYHCKWIFPTENPGNSRAFYNQPFPQGPFWDAHPCMESKLSFPGYFLWNGCWNSRWKSHQDRPIDRISRKSEVSSLEEKMLAYSTASM